MLYEFIALHRDEILRRCRSKVATRSVPPPTVAEMTNGVPRFLDQLTDLRRSQVVRSNDDILALTEQWKSAMVGRGWA